MPAKETKEWFREVTGKSERDDKLKNFVPIPWVLLLGNEFNHDYM